MNPVDESQPLETLTHLADGKISKVDEDYIELTLERPVGPMRDAIHHVERKVWTQWHGEPQVGQSIECVSTGWSEHFRINFYGFQKKRLDPISPACMVSVEQPGR